MPQSTDRARRRWPLLVVLPVLLGGCGGDPSGPAESTATGTASIGTGSAETVSGASVSPVSSNPAPSDPVPSASDSSVRVDELAILGSGNRAAIVAAVEAEHGMIVSETKETETYRVRFPVQTQADLDAVRKRLRAKGIDGALVLKLDNP
jgi:hypothetical protein